MHEKVLGNFWQWREAVCAINLLTAAWKLISRNTTDHRAILAAVFAEPFVVKSTVSPAGSDWTSKWRARSAGKGGSTTVPVVSSGIPRSRVYWPLNSHSRCSSLKSRMGCTHSHSLAYLNSFWKISPKIFPICQFRKGVSRPLSTDKDCLQSNKQMVLVTWVWMQEFLGKCSWWDSNANRKTRTKTTYLYTYIYIYI